jgi:hypothetical protein
MTAMAPTPRFTPATIEAVRSLVGDPANFDFSGKNLFDPATVAAVKLDTPDKAAVLDGLKAAHRLYRIRPDLALVFDLSGRGIDSVDALSAFLRRTTPSCA